MVWMVFQLCSFSDFKTLTMDGIAHDLQYEKQQEIMIDSFISQSRHVEAGRELAPWVPDEDDPHSREWVVCYMIF